MTGARDGERLVHTEIGCWCSKVLEVDSQFRCSLNASVIFQQMECRRLGLPKLSYTKLIFIHRDLGTFGDLPGKETYVNMPHNATVTWWFLDDALLCLSRTDVFCALQPLHRNIGCNSCLKGTKHDDFPHAEQLNKCVLCAWLHSSSIARSNSNDVFDSIS